MDTIDAARNRKSGNRNPLETEETIDKVEELLKLIDGIDGSEMTKNLLRRAVSELIPDRKIKTTADIKLPGAAVIEYEFKKDRLIFTPGALRLLGIDKDKAPLDILSLQRKIQPDDIPAAAGEIREYFEHSSSYILFECRIISSNGKWNWVEFRGEVVESAPDGSPARLLGIVSDISRRKKTENISENSETRYRYLIEHFQEGVCIMDDTLRVTYVSNVFCKYMDVRREDILGRRLESFLYRDYREKMIKALEKVSKGEKISCEMDRENKNGSNYYLQASLQGIFDSAGDLIGVMAVFSDVSTKLVFQEDIKDSEKKYHALFQTAPLAIAFLLSDGRIQNCNPKFRELVEEKVDDCHNVDFISFLSKESEKKALKNILKKNGYLQNQDFILRKSTGVDFTASLNIAPLVVSGENIFLVIAEDITERKTAEQQLKKARDELEIRVAERTAALMRSEKELQERLRELTCLFNIRHEFDGDDRLEDTLRRCAEHIRQAMHNPDRKSVEIEINNVKLLSEGQFMPSDYVLESSLLVDGRTIGWLRVFSYSSESWHQPFEQDLVWGVGITLSSLIEQRELKAQLIHAEKMAASGRVAAGVAHEINNPLGAIKNSLYILQKAIQKEHPDYQYVELMDSEISRVAGIISQLYDLYKPSSQQIQPVDLNLIVENVLKILQSKIKRRRITVETDLDKTLPKISTSLNQITQVLYNIIENAIQAMETEGGKLIVISRVRKRVICISISDTGPGIPEDVLPHIFEPFFSTKGVSKASGEGMGIGLSLSRSIMESLGGEISVETQPSHGTTFILSFPTR